MGCDVAGVFALLVFSVVAGSAFLFTSYASQDIPPITLCALRLGLGCCSLTLISLIIPKPSLSVVFSKHFIGTAIVMGLFNNFIPYSLYPYSYNLGVGVGIASIFSGCTPLLVLCFSIIGMPEKRQYLCNKLSFAGVCISVFCLLSNHVDQVLRLVFLELLSCH